MFSADKTRTRTQSLLLTAAFVVGAIVILVILGRGTTLRIDSECRNNAFIDEDFQIWFVTDPDLPAEWQNRGEVSVEYSRVSGENPTIELDGLTFNVATRRVLPPCQTWP